MDLTEEAIDRIYKAQEAREKEAMKKQCEYLSITNHYAERLKLLDITFNDFDIETCKRLLQKIDPKGYELMKVGGMSYYNRNIRK